MDKDNMIKITKILGIFFFGFVISCTVVSQENPTEMFDELSEKYLKTEYKSKRLEGGPPEGMGIMIFDVKNKLSKDLFCQFNLYSSVGQTQYLIYQKESENIWYFHKEVLFYEEPYEIENAEIINTYFKFTNNLPYVFNEATGKYDIQADTNQYIAIVDVGSLARLIEIVQDAINEK